MPIETRENYDHIMRTELDRIAEINYARDEGMQQGMQQGAEQSLVKNVTGLLNFGMSPEDIAKALDIPLEKVLYIKSK